MPAAERRRFPHADRDHLDPILILAERLSVRRRFKDRSVRSYMTLSRNDRHHPVRSVSATTPNIRFQVGEITTSLRQTCGGSDAT